MKPRLLIVDDDEMVLKALRLELEDRYAVLTTRQPGEVLPLAHRERPDLILCDIEMPGTDGGDLSAALFADGGTRDIPLLFLTGLASPADLTNTRGELAGRPAISKSAPIGQLIEKIEALLQR
jgi:putative two-component system response regulator